VRVVGRGRGSGVDPPLLPQTLLARPTRPETVAARRARGAARLVAAAAVAYAVLAVGAAIFRVARARASPRAVRARTVDRNKAVVSTLDALLPANRDALTPAVCRGLKRDTGFSGVEIFRKFLWFLLRERRFDEDAVADVVALRAALDLSDADVAAAITERAARVYAQYGTLMLNDPGLTAAGLERKAACRALFSKLLFLAECDAVLPQGDGAPAGGRADVQSVFGATDDDAAKLRIVSLVEVDLDKLEGQFGGGGEEGGGGADGGW
jgi:hypothetical protein